MKHQINLISLWVTIMTLFILPKTTIAQPPPTPCDTCNYDVEVWKGPDSSVYVTTFDTSLSPMYDGCEPFDPLRKPGIAYIHGLGGDISSWFKQVTWTDTFHHTACFGVDYGSSNYEVNFHTVAHEVNTDLYSGYNAGINYAYPNRCKLNDYVIAHSQGGLAARYLDRQWDVSTSGTFGNRKFYGVVTFGTPNGGAHIAYTKDDHFDFVQGTVSTIYMAPLAEKAYAISKQVGFLIGFDVFDITTKLDSTLKNTLAPLMLAPQHSNTLDEMRPDHPTLLSLKNHNTRLHRVAFYGIEKAPECWRVIDNIIVKPSTDYDLWGAQPDDTLVARVEKVRAHHVGEILANKKKIKNLGYKNAGIIVVGVAAMPFTYGASSLLGIVSNKIIAKQRTITSENSHRQQAVDFLDNANTQWRYIIGSYHRDSFSYDTITYYELTWEEKYGWAGKWYNQKREFSTHAKAQSHYANLSVYKKRDGLVTAKTRIVKVKAFYPSDGIVLAKSQKDFPDISEKHTDLMVDNNHMQERNSSETHRVLTLLYNGDYDEFFKITP